MKKKIVMTGMAMLAFGFAGLQAAKGPKKGPGKGNPCDRLEQMHRFMKDSLGLTADQDKKIIAINDSACKRLTDAKNTYAGDREKMKTQAQAIMKDTRESWKKVLTPDQQKKLKAKKSREGHGKPDSAKRAEKMTEKMKTELSLNETQTAQVKSANELLLQRMKDLKARKDAGADSASIRKEAKKIHEDYDAKMKTILTTEQYEKFVSMRKEMRKNHAHRGRPKQ